MLRVSSTGWFDHATAPDLNGGEAEQAAAEESERLAETTP